MIKVLVIHGYEDYPLRSTIRDHLFAFRKHLHNAQCFYLRLTHKFEIPEHIKKIDFDIVIFHTVYLAARWSGADYFREHLIEKCKYFAGKRAVKIVMPQDEWIHTDLLNQFVNQVGVDIVLTVAPESEWKKIYDRVDHQKVRFYQGLTGYIEKRTLKKVNKLKKTHPDRSVDIGYRAFKSPPWLGSHGFLKTKIADVFDQASLKSDLKIDVSTDPQKTIIGDAWYEFMLNCRYFIGVEGGSTILDPSGEIWKRGSAYMKLHPEADFAEVERSCFPGKDGNLWLICVSPRHLEACMTETCQILVEGEYNGILKPDIHYIPLKSDFSNLNEVLTKLSDEPYRLNMVQATYRDVIESGKYTYKAFVKNITGYAAANPRWAVSGVRISDWWYLAYNAYWEKYKLTRLHERWPYLGKDIHWWFKFTVFPRITGRLGKIKKAIYKCVGLQVY